MEPGGSIRLAARQRRYPSSYHFSVLIYSRLRLAWGSSSACTRTITQGSDDAPAPVLRGIGGNCMDTLGSRNRELPLPTRGDVMPDDRVALATRWVAAFIIPFLLAAFAI